MKLKLKHIPALGMVAAAAALSLGTSCTDQLAFGNAFLEKAPGGTVTADTVFNKGEYTKYFLANIYAYQYYNIPVGGSNKQPQCYNWFKGMPDALSDTHVLLYTGSAVYGSYYNGMLTANDRTIYPYNELHIFENIRACYLLLERIDDVPDLSEKEKASMKDEAKCLLAWNYLGALRFYGGLPIVKHSYTGAEDEYEGRATLQETVDFILGLLDEVIQAKNLAWGYGDKAVMESEQGHWTIAGAMAAKIQLLQFIASPLFNDDQPYYAGKYEMENPLFVWFGKKDQQRWTDLKNACEEFFSAMNANGVYHLIDAKELCDTNNPTAGDYAYAYRYSYYMRESPEVIHSVRISTYPASGGTFSWFNYGFGDVDNGTSLNERLAYAPTQEYVEMFPWADGTPFDWNKAEAEGKLNEMFIKGEKVQGQQMLQNIQYTRDPRLYETVRCNNVPCVSEWNNGNRSGEPYEYYVGGSIAGTNPETQTGNYATGYANLKYLVGRCAFRQYVQWSPLMLSDIYLTYAEAIIQSGGSCSDALKYVDAVRARVGMKGLAECNPDKNLTNNKDNLLEEILRERACEFGLHMTRYLDMVRYKRDDIFTKTLHGLKIYRLVDGQRDETPWWNAGDRSNYSNQPNNPRFYQPNEFDYERVELSSWGRAWWNQKGNFDPKWYLQPFPITEVNKGYGLYQNPGW